MLLFNPRDLSRFYPDERSAEIMKLTVNWFEAKGKTKLLKDDFDRIWYQDFLDFLAENHIFADLLTPTPYGDGSTRWDTWRNCEFNEILAFYGLHYWYTWQVSILGLGPLWMTENEGIKNKTAKFLEEGGVFAFGLSEKEHGADIYSTEMSLSPQEDGNYLANGSKYYIGNGNIAKMVSTFGKMTDSGDYVAFVANYQHENYDG